MADTEATKAGRMRSAMLPFEEAEHCEHFTEEERTAIMVAVNRVKSEADKMGCTHIGGISNEDIAFFQAVSCSLCGAHLGTVLPTSDGGKKLG